MSNLSILGAHDPTVCFCDTTTSCLCPCSRCVESSKQALKLQRLLALEAKLKKANIDPDDFAELIWVRIEATIEDRMRRVVTQLVREAMRKIHFQVKAQ